MPDVKMLPGLPSVASDVQIGVGDGFWPPVEEISSADQVTVIGDGTTRRPLHAGAVASGGQAFEAAVGAATDPDGFDVALPVAMADGTWIPEVALQPPTVDDVVSVFVLSRSATTLRLGASSNFADGTTLLITINAKTN
jgi:hypothetical protein